MTKFFDIPTLLLPPIGGGEYSPESGKLDEGVNVKWGEEEVWGRKVRVCVGVYVCACGWGGVGRGGGRKSRGIWRKLGMGLYTGLYAGERCKI